MIGRHQMRGWRKLKSGLMRITGSAHIYYPIREIDSCRRRTRHSNFGEGGGPDHYLSFVLPVVQWLNALNWDPVGGQGLLPKIIILVLIVFFCFLIGIGSVIKNDWYGSPFSSIHSFGSFAYWIRDYFLTKTRTSPEAPRWSYYLW